MSKITIGKPTNCMLYDIYGHATKVDGIKEIYISSEPYYYISLDNIYNINYTSFQFTIKDIKNSFLTKRQNHLSEYGKYRVRKKYNNMVWKKFLGKKRRN